MRKSKQKTLVPKDKFEELENRYARAKSREAERAILISMLEPADTYERCYSVYIRAMNGTKFKAAALQKLKTLANEKSSDP
jgi:hypothetical protein